MDNEDPCGTVRTLLSGGRAPDTEAHDTLIEAHLSQCGECAEWVRASSKRLDNEIRDALSSVGLVWPAAQV